MSLNIRAIVVACVLAAVSCALVTSLDDLGAADAAGGDALVTGDATNDAAPDVTSDASNDVAPSDGAACDAGFCACVKSQHAFCNDFDEDGGLQGNFTGVAGMGNASGAIDSTESASAPRSAKFQLAAMDAGVIEGSWLYWNGQPQTSDYTMEAKLFMPARPTTSNSYEVMDIEMPNGSELVYFISSANEGFLVSCHAPCTTQGDAGTAVTFYPSLALATNKWVDVKLHVTLGATLSATITYDGASALSLSGLKFAFPPAQPVFDVGGVFAIGPGAAFAVAIDDVTFDNQ